MALENHNFTKEERKAQKKARRLEKELRKSQALRENNQHGPVTQILCVRFGNKYGNEYVIKLRDMVARHITVPYRFNCLTDDPKPLEGVNNIVIPNKGYQRGWWHKVHMFDPSLPLEGRILYMDLDVVIHNNIDKLCNVWLDDFMGIRDFNRKFHPNYKYLNSSVMAWNARTQSHVYQNFMANPAQAQRLHGDQDWIWQNCREVLKFWPEEWVMSYKWEIRDKSELHMKDGQRQFKTVRDDVVPPKENSIMVFHGDPNPGQVKDKLIIDNWK